MHYEFPTTAPQDVFVELQGGDLRVTAETSQESGAVTVDVMGDGEDGVDVRQHETTLSIEAPRRTGFFAGRIDVAVRVRVPAGSTLVTRVGSADVTGRGTFATVDLTTGSGDVSVDTVTGHAAVKTGSGSIAVRTIGGNARVKAGSGDITLGHVAGSAQLSTGSGSIEVRSAEGALSLKSGSGDVTVGHVAHEATLTAASGDLSVGHAGHGRLELNNVSGDIQVAVPPGTPVWSDVTSLTGRVRCDLPPTGAPAEGQPYVELRAKTVSGSIHLLPAATDPASTTPVEGE